MRTIAFMAAVLALHPVVSSLHAQGSDARLPSGTALGVTADRFSIQSEYGVTALTFHVSSLHPNKLNPEFAVSLFPVTLGEGSMMGNVDLGGALNVPLPNATLLVRGGASGVFAFGRATGALPGVHYGVSLLVKVSPSSAIRFDVIRRIYGLPGFTSSSLTLGFGISSLPKL